MPVTLGLEHALKGSFWQKSEPWSLNVFSLLFPIWDVSLFLFPQVGRF